MNPADQMLAGLRLAGVLKEKRGPTPTTKPAERRRRKRKAERQARRKGRRDG